MAPTTCNGLCARHPKRTKKRIQAIDFDITKDAVCRKCECYFKNIEGQRCPCCKAKFSRRLTTMNTLKKKMRAIQRKLVYSFRYFWNMIERKHRRKPHYRKKNIDRSNRKCLICNSTKTYIQKHGLGSAVWLRYMHGYICLKCHIRNTRRNKSFAKCPLSTFLLSSSSSS